jgi:uncharacterized protein (TIGR02147 family)
MNIYEATNYKDFLGTKILAYRMVKGYKSKLAKAAGFSPSFLSQVIHGHVELTPEHALRLAQFWELNENETDYFMLLVDHSRAGSIILRNRISQKMEAFKQSVLGERRASVH